VTGAERSSHPIASLDELLFASGLAHEQVLLDRLEEEGPGITASGSPRQRHPHHEDYF